MSIKEDKKTNVISWLQKQDLTIRYLTNKYLLDQPILQQNQGYIERYLNLFDNSKKTWGNGYYGPKWISTHYTMLELRYLEISYDHPTYQEGMNTLLKHLWKNSCMYNKTRHVDLCIAGMLLHMCCYGKSQDIKIYEIIDYILSHQFADGGWNCTWDSGENPRISSVHTTINVLEGLRDYLNNEYDYKKQNVATAIYKATELLLTRELFKSYTDGKPMHDQMIKPHYPPRWKYDLLRALEFFVSINHPYDFRMKDAINLIKNQLKGPFMPKGITISGQIHFKLEEGKYGALNTYRALKILKNYQNTFYLELIHMDIKE